MKVTEGWSPAMTALEARPANAKLALAAMKARRDTFLALLFRSSVMIRLQSFSQAKRRNGTNCVSSTPASLDREVPKKRTRLKLRTRHITSFPRFAIRRTAR
jgi:hypothetical protein